MLKYITCAFLLMSFSVLMSQNRFYELRVENDSIIFINNKAVNLNELHQVLTEEYTPKIHDSEHLTSLTLIVDHTTSDLFIDEIKEKIRKTDYNVLNIQRSSIQNFSNSSVVTKSIISQYNTLIRYWKSLEEDERYYREIELNFIKDIYKKMSFEQQVNNEKLPSFLPIFNKEPEQNKIEQFLFEKWFFDDAYLVKIDGEKIEKTSLSSYKPTDFDHYFIERKIIGEQKIDVINLVLKD